MRGNQVLVYMQGKGANFNSRLCMRGNLFCGTVYTISYISILASAWEATSYLLQGPRLRTISILASAWEATLDSHVEQCREHISILASAWEATVRTMRSFAFHSISILASAWEATGCNWNLSLQLLFQFSPLHERQRIRRCSELSLSCYFNSRLCMRGNKLYAAATSIFKISILASAWEATEKIVWKGISDHISILASAWEATAKIHNLFDKIYIIFYQTLFFL